MRILAFFLLLPVLVSCRKNGTGGEAEIHFMVAHHHVVIPGATVYIKYGAKDFPGEDVSVYDDSFQTPSTGSEAGMGKFSGLLKGDYYIFSTGFDSSINQKVIGGVPVKLKKSEGEVHAEVHVTE